MINEIIQMIKKKIRIKGSCVVAVDGRCGSGKTTLAKILEETFDCNVFHVDDFYIPMDKRNEERLGNVDSVRLSEEVLKPLKAEEEFSYRTYSCMEGILSEPIKVKNKAVTIVEGSYSCQQELFEFYDLRIFVDVGKDMQQTRLGEREGAERLKVFNEKWIPMEERYFTSTQLKYKCEIYYKTSV